MTISHEDQPSPSKCNGGQLLKMSVQEAGITMLWSGAGRAGFLQPKRTTQMSRSPVQEPTQTSRSPSKSARSQRSATSSAADEAQQRRTQPARPAAASIRCCEAKVVKLKGSGAHMRSVADEPMSRTLLKPAQRYQLSRGRSAAATSSSQHTVLRSKGSQLTQAEVIDGKRV